MRGRRGVMALEALVAFLLMLLVLQGGWTLVAGMARSAVVLADRAEALAGARAAAWILQEELVGARAGLDVQAPLADSLALRAFRGVALPCGPARPGGLPVRWAGIRGPDVEKDSVLLLSPLGRWEAHALLRRAAAKGGCDPAADPAPWVGPVASAASAPPAIGEEQWTLDPPADGALLMRFFERGSYHLSGSALRYRIGGGGRQPLTPASLDTRDSGISVAAPGGVRVKVVTVGVRRGGKGVGWLRTFRLQGRW